MNPKEISLRCAHVYHYARISQPDVTPAEVAATLQKVATHSTLDLFSIFAITTRALATGEKTWQQVVAVAEEVSRGSEEDAQPVPDRDPAAGGS